MMYGLLELLPLTALHDGNTPSFLRAVKLVWCLVAAMMLRGWLVSTTSGVQTNLPLSKWAD